MLNSQEVPKQESEVREPKLVEKRWKIGEEHDNFTKLPEGGLNLLHRQTLEVVKLDSLGQSDAVDVDGNETMAQHFLELSPFQALTVWEIAGERYLYLGELHITHMPGRGGYADAVAITDSAYFISLTEWERLKAANPQPVR